MIKKNIFSQILIAFFLLQINLFSIELHEGEKYLLKKSFTYLETEKDLTLEEFLETDPLTLKKGDFLSKSYDNQLWGKITLNNISNRDLELAVYHLESRVDVIDFYLLKNKEIKQKYVGGIYRNFYKKNLPSQKHGFILHLDKQEELQLIVRIKDKAVKNLNIIVEPLSDFYKFNSDKVLIFLLGVIFAIILYNVAIATLIDYKILYAYAFNSVFLLLMYLQMLGYFTAVLPEEFLPLSDRLNRFYTPAHLMFLIYFYYSYLGLESYKKIDKYMKALVVLFVGCAAYYLLYAFFNIEMNLMFDNGFRIVAFSTFFLLLFVAFLQARKKRVEGIFAFLGIATIIIKYIFFVGGITGAIDLGKYLYEILLLFALLENAIIAFALMYKFRTNLKVANENEKLLLEQSKLAMLGRVLGFITHQWKQPLNRIAAINLKLYTKVSSENYSDELIEDIKELDKTVEFMGESVGELKSIYKTDGNKRVFSPKKEVENVILLFEQQLQELGIEVHNEIGKTILINNASNSFVQVCMNIIQNSIENFQERRVVNPKINIIGKVENNYFILKIEDNGGGIEEESLEKIFERNLSSKKSTGMGLNMVQLLVTNRLDGTVEAKNSTQGLIIEVTLKNNHTKVVK